MTDRAALHRLVDSLTEEQLETAGHLLAGLASADIVERALLLAPDDDEPDTPEERAGVEEAHREIREGRTMSHGELKRRLGLG